MPDKEEPKRPAARRRYEPPRVTEDLPLEVRSVSCNKTASTCQPGVNQVRQAFS